ncbi:MAG: prolyl oligopeptidase family serine peptidase [Candidatus Omnitrophota bacterium]
MSDYAFSLMKKFASSSYGRGIGGFALLSIALFANCATIRLDSHYTGPAPRSESLCSEFAVPASWSVKRAERKAEGFERLAIDWPDRESSEQPLLIMDYYPSSQPGLHPGILISPILGGENRIASHFARYLSERGYHSLVVHRPPEFFKGTPHIDHIEDQLRNAVIRDCLALDWLAARPEVDGDALGSFGISYGGIKNVILAAVDQRLKANVFALAGGDLASIFNHSNLKKIRRFRNYSIKKNKTTPREWEKLVREKMLAEPLRCARFVDADRCMMILARMDHTVPRRNGELLRKALGRPKTVYLPAGHYSAVFFTGFFLAPYVETQVIQFFDEQFRAQLPKISQSSTDTGRAPLR